MTGLDVIGADPIVGFNWAGLASGLLKGAGGIADSFGGGGASGGAGGGDAAAAERLRQEAEARARAEEERRAAEARSKLYRNIAIGAGAVVLAGGGIYLLRR